MKTILSVFTMLSMICSIQANDLKTSTENISENPFNMVVDDPINLKTILTNILKNSRAYYMTGSVTIIKAPINGDVATSLDASFRNSIIKAYKGRTYIQANVKAQRNDTNKTDEVRVYVHADNKGPALVDKNKVKINWKGSGSGEIAGNLSNVSVLHQNDSILITGTLQKNGYTIGVSLAITKEVKLI